MECVFKSGERHPALKVIVIFFLALLDSRSSNPNIALRVCALRRRLKLFIVKMSVRGITTHGVRGDLVAMTSWQVHVSVSATMAMPL